MSEIDQIWIHAMQGEVEIGGFPGIELESFRCIRWYCSTGGIWAILWKECGSLVGIREVYVGISWKDTISEWLSFAVAATPNYARYV